MDLRDPTTAKSPCKGICKIDEQSTYCEGCYRTLEEIKQWSKMCEVDREKVNKKALHRKAEVATKKLLEGTPYGYFD